MSFMVNYRFTLRVLKYFIHLLKYDIKLDNKMILIIIYKIMFAMFVTVSRLVSK